MCYSHSITAYHSCVHLVWPEDPDSSRAAFYFASVQNYFLTLTSLATISQASQDPLVPNILVVNLLQCVTEVPGSG